MTSASSSRTYRFLDLVMALFVTVLLVSNIASSAKIVDWAADQWALGGYSSSPVGSLGLRKALATSQPPLFFAGEATVYDDSPATVHGALRSGERAAGEVLSL